MFYALFSIVNLSYETEDRFEVRGPSRLSYEDRFEVQGPILILYDEARFQVRGDHGCHMKCGDHTVFIVLSK